MNNSDWLILNVDDEPAIRYVKTRALQRAGYRVIDAASGYDGLSRVESHHPDLVLCDVKMADINGLEVCRRIKERHPEILVLQVSASFVSTRDRVTGLELGADSYLTEPVEPDELVAAVRALLRMKKGEDDLRALNARLESEVAQRTRERDRIWTVSSELLAVIADDGFLRSINPAWSVLGYEEQDLLDMPFSELVVPEDRDAVASKLHKLLHGDNTQFEGRLRCRDGSYRWIAWTATRDEDLCYALGRDITAEKSRQQELESTQLQLRQAQKMEALGQLTGGIAHDFNNLLTGIIGSLDLLERRLAKKRFDDLGHFAAVASSSAKRAAALTNRLLVFSRMQSLQRSAVDIRALVASTEEMLRRTMGERVKLGFSLPEDLWLVETDANQVEVALLNLVLNSRDAMPNGGEILIELSNQTVATGSAGANGLAPGDYVRVRVRDTGIGMPKDVMEKAFDPFFTTKPVGQGTGLGLSMVYGFATQSKGAVRISSVPDKGTTIDVYLPRFLGPTSEDRDSGTDGEKALHGEGVVLVTEDDASVRTVVTTVLEELGYRPLVASTGEEAIELLESPIQVDLLITDIQLPGKSGLEVVEIARLKRPSLKVLLMTGYAHMVNGARLNLDRTQLIRKPFDIDAFAGKVRRCMEAVA